MRVGLLFLVGLALSARLAAGQGAPVAPANEDCLACHGDPAAARASGTPVSVDPVVLAASVHGETTCVSCHADLAKQSEWPHAEKLARATCASCHASAFQGYVESEHGRGRLKSGLNVAPDCATCHGSHDVRRIADPESATHRAHVAATCARCHEGILPEYEKSVHAQQVAAGNTAAAVCSDCHTSHRVQRPESDQWKLAVVAECGTCHVERIATYRDTYHGKVTELGFTRVATCTSCHSNHAIQRASDPASTVAPANLVTTCRQCHADANANFVKYNPHADKDDREGSPALYWASRGMQWLLGGVFLFFGAHTLLWFPRSWKARRERDAEATASCDGTQP